jgi:hypothetical protein
VKERVSGAEETVAAAEQPESALAEEPSEAAADETPKA